MISRRCALVCLLFFAVGVLAEAQTSPWPFPSSSAAPPGFPRNSITATFWNIQWFPGRRPNASDAEQQRQISEVHRDIAQLTPDVFGMEEVRDTAHAALAVQPLAGFKVDVCSNFPPREGQTEAQQVAIASRLQPISAWAEAWKPGGAITPPRGFAFAAYQLAPKNILLVYALHLKSNRGEIHEDMRIREESMRQLLSHMTAMKAAYAKLGALTWIVGGDFNTAPDDLRFAGEKTISDLSASGFNWSWQNVALAARITMPPDRRFPAASFDQIFYRGATLARAWVAPTSPKSSDHRAVNVVLNVAP
ncbi:MAG: endonuclease/exonuclease/phosphatase family protein [Chthoniobacterales bacterium]